MEDLQIIELYWQRDEEAIVQSETKYGGYCRAIARQILPVTGDVEECLSDTWLAAWRAIPPQRPQVLRTFFGRLSRNLAINKSVLEHAQKRGGGEVPLALEELKECISAKDSVEAQAEVAELGQLIDRFLRTLPQQECSLFLRRYWYVESLEEIARRYGLRKNTVKTCLFRTRNKLRAHLEREGISV